VSHAADASCDTRVGACFISAPLPHVNARVTPGRGAVIARRWRASGRSRDRGWVRTHPAASGVQRERPSRKALPLAPSASREIQPDHVGGRGCRPRMRGIRCSTAVSGCAAPAHWYGTAASVLQTAAKMVRAAAGERQTVARSKQISWRATAGPRWAREPEMGARSARGRSEITAVFRALSRWVSSHPPRRVSRSLTGPVEVDVRGARPERALLFDRRGVSRSRVRPARHLRGPRAADVAVPRAGRPRASSVSLTALSRRTRDDRRSTSALRWVSRAFASSKRSNCRPRARTRIQIPGAPDSGAPEHQRRHR